MDEPPEVRRCEQPGCSGIMRLYVGTDPTFARSSAGSSTPTVYFYRCPKDEGHVLVVGPVKEHKSR